MVFQSSFILAEVSMVGIVSTAVATSFKFAWRSVRDFVLAGKLLLCRLGIPVEENFKVGFCFLEILLNWVLFS